MKRFYMAPVVGDGTEENPYRSKIGLQYPISQTCQLVTDEQGRPLHSMCLVEVESEDFTELDADNELADVTLEREAQMAAVRGEKKL